VIRFGSRLFRRFWAVSGVSFALGWGGAAARADLDSYVRKPDPSFGWRQVANHDTPLGKIHSLELTSQVWQGITWTHDLTIYEPAEIIHRDAALLFITGGRTGGKPDQKDHQQAFTLTKATGARVAVLRQVPNQPLLGDKTEDTLIAETFVRYLETQDENWPLLFPMVKSAVRALDAVQAWSRQDDREAIERFVVAGASKRGWTTWLTAAVDNRVVGIAPMVIVMLNMGLQGPNQLEVWGQYSEQIDDYVNRGLMEQAQTELGTKLWKMVDPYSFRDRLSLPKLLINGTNDRYWTLNALDLYWDGLKDPKYLMALPNAGHGLENNRDWAINGLGAFFRQVVSGRPLPSLSWSAEPTTGGGLVVKVQADPAPIAARLWTATSQNRDFRESTWTPSPLAAETRIEATVEKPSQGKLACFVELEYRCDGIPYHLTTTFFEPGLK